MCFLAETTPLGLDKTWWTAIGTLLALAIALGGAFIPAIVRYLRRPKLRIEYERCSEFSSTVNDKYWLRIPISNSGLEEAKNVEVFLEEFSKLSSEKTERISGIVPMRIKWCNTNNPSHPSIPQKSFRLLDLGSVDLNSKTKTEGDELQVLGFPSFTLGGEVHVESHAPLAMGSFLLTVSISADGISPHQHKVVIVVRKAKERKGPPAKVEKA